MSSRGWRHVRFKASGVSEQAAAATLLQLVIVSCLPGSRAVYFESHSSCGFDTSNFIDFSSSRAAGLGLEPLGTCGWGFTELGVSAGGDGSVGKCLQCKFVPVPER